jgi:hypothetical protein
MAFATSFKAAGFQESRVIFLFVEERARKEKIVPVKLADSINQSDLVGSC